MGTAGKNVTLVLCTGDGILHGALPPFQVDTPWWPEVTEVVERARELHGVDTTVLRLLAAPEEDRSGGDVAYLAEVYARPAADLLPWPGDPVVDHPLRQPYARLGGPRRDVDWALEVLSTAGLSVGRPRQVKTWNLSSIWCIPTSEGDTWLKVVPPFFAHEGVIIDHLDSPCVPRLIGAQAGRTLMAHIDGVDHLDTTGPPLVEMVEQLIGLQLANLGRVPQLLSLGLPDRRLREIGPRFTQVVDDQASALDVSERRGLDRLLHTLETRIGDLEACGVPDALVHGDFHPGNVRGTPHRYVILDWGDSAVGHPMTDELAFFRPLGADNRDLVRTAWASAWRRAVPGCDPDRAATLLQPLMPMLAAVMYADFCANIEPDELVYHARDVPSALRDAAQLA